MNEVTYGEWTTLGEIPLGALFEFHDGYRAVKTGWTPNSSYITWIEKLGNKIQADNNEKVRLITLPPFEPPEPELLPCPFCGEEPVADFSQDYGGFISCVNNDCHVLVKIKLGHEYVVKTKAEAIAAWNRRAK